MEKQPGWVIAMDTVAIAVFFFYVIVLTGDLVDLFVHGNLSAVTLAIAALLGYLLADFLSGFVHFLGDSFGTETTPILGAAFIFPFRKHHRDPEDITKHGFIETNGHNCLVSLPMMMALVYAGMGLAEHSAVAAFFFAIAYFLIVGVFMTNQFHKWAHMKKRPAFISWLQKYRLILSPTHHKIHHTAPFNRYYCITTGWLNLLLDKLKFFPISKFTIRRIPFMLKTAEEYVDIKKRG